MSEITTVGLDLAKHVFVASGASSIEVHGADASGRMTRRKTLRPDQVLAFFSQLSVLRRRDGGLWWRPFLGARDRKDGSRSAADPIRKAASTRFCRGTSRRQAEPPVGAANVYRSAGAAGLVIRGMAC